MRICDYHGCVDIATEKTVRRTDDGSPPRKRYCEKHESEITELMKDKNPGRMVAWWIKAGGGAKKMSETF